MPKPVPILSRTPQENKPYAILPVGLYCNKKLQQVKPGEIVEFWTDWRHDTRRIVQMTKFRTNTPEFTFLMRSVYGQHFRLADLMARWEAECVNEGIGANGFSRDEALVVEVEEVNEEEV